MTVRMSVIVLSLLSVLTTGVVPALVGQVLEQGNAPAVTAATLDTIVTAMANERMVTTRHVGRGGTEPEQWRRYLRLRDAATDDDLLALVDHNSPVVRCYAFRALAERRHAEAFPILVRHMMDTTVVTVFSSCLLSGEAVADYLLGTVSPSHVYFASGAVLNAEQRATVDSILLFTPHLRLLHRRWLLDRLPASEGSYQRLRVLVVAERESDALAALARHRRPEDRPLILAAIRSRQRDLLYNGLQAADAFPDESFYNDLVKVFRRHRAEGEESNGEFERVCIALAQYPRSSTVTLFRDAPREKSKWRRDDILEAVSAAVSTHRDPIFVELLPLLGMDQDAVAAYRRSLEQNDPE